MSATKLPRSQSPSDAQGSCAPGHLDEGHDTPGLQACRALVDLLSDQDVVETQTYTVAGDLPTDQDHGASQPAAVCGDLTDDQVVIDAQAGDVVGHYFVEPDLLAAVDSYRDTQALRIATENRARSLKSDGFNTELYDDQVAALKKMEGRIQRRVAKEMRAGPFGPWIASQRGVGELSVAKFLGIVGTLTYNTLEERPRRGPAELWAYCGFVPGQKRTRGERANWSTEAKTAAFLMAESCVKSGGEYRDLYDQFKARYADRVHEAECKRCGPAGKPAQPGSPWSDGHKDAAAKRAVAKRIIRDLYVESKRIGA
jgi:hypothetical protein